MLWTFRLFGVAFVLLMGIAATALVVITRLSLPASNGTYRVAGLRSPVEIEFDALANPRIHGVDRNDVYSALGYVHARDRLFQMDLFRRSASGQLAEIFGADALRTDIWNRAMGFDRLADQILLRLPSEQRDVLNAYSAGVNRAMQDATAPPLEFIFLGYRPKPWRSKDSILVILGLASLSYDESAERMATVMRRALPPEVTEFLTPESDCYNEVLAPRNPKRCGADAAPFDRLAELMRRHAGARSSGLTGFSITPHGSNAWAVAPSKTRDGRAIVANDMHLPLEAPNIWYRAQIDLEPARLEGLTLPGVPMLVSGSNGHVAWGFTSVEGDFSDLVRIEANPSDPTTYLTPEGAKPFETRAETISVRGGADKTIEVRETIWGPILPQPLLGADVAVRWTALDPAATNLDLIEIDHVSTLDAAKTLFGHAGGLPLNVILADHAGNIAWMLMGRLPKRFGADGLFSESWADGTRGWNGYYAPEELPSVTNPPSGFLVSTNQRMASASQFTPTIGHDFSGGYRAWRVTERLRAMSGITEQDMLSLQLDTDAAFYRYYQSLALSALDGLGPAAADDETSRLRRYLESWNGRADVESTGLPLLVEFRQTLIDAVISPIVAECRKADPSFIYYWSGADEPVRRIIDSKRSELLPERATYHDWPEFIRAKLSESARRLLEKNGVASLSELTWGKAYPVEIRHSVAGGIPLLGRLFNMPRSPLAGCQHCVRFLFSNPIGRSGANSRMVVSPGREEDGILQMIGGQSGQLGSAHYSDQQADWVSGRARALRIGEARSRIILEPGDH